MSGAWHVDVRDPLVGDELHRVASNVTREEAAGYIARYRGQAGCFCRVYLADREKPLAERLPHSIAAPRRRPVTKLNSKQLAELMSEAEVL